MKNPASFSSEQASYERRVVIVMTALLLMSGAGCAGNPPTKSLQAAEFAIAAAEKGRVPDYASPELIEAREKFAAANTAVEHDDMKQAQRLAEEARVNAELALARAELVKAMAINEEILKATEALKQELQRNEGAFQ